MKKIISYLFVTAIVVVAAALAFVWSIAFRPNVNAETPVRIYIPEGSSFSEMHDILKSSEALKNNRNFLLVTRLKRYDRRVKPGSYLLEPGMNNNALVNMLRSGRQAPVKVTFNNIRTLEELAGKIGKQIVADSSDIIGFLNDEANYSEDGFNRETVISLFLPDSYQLYWTTDAHGLYSRMLKEYKAFWNDERVSRAAALKLTPVGVSILASIIDEEQSKNDEKPRIAGVYLNRLRLGMPLQACPTIKFAMNDFTIQRVLDEYLTIESPYNTYTHRGLPPGPVRCPSKAGIEAVLNAEKHNYLYFTARSDFSGYHHFSLTYDEHIRYSKLYQRELNKKKIYK